METSDLNRKPTQQEILNSINILKNWLIDYSNSENNSLFSRTKEPQLLPNPQPFLKKSYQKDFTADDNYIKQMPDVQNDPKAIIKGENIPIQHVGISNFRLPIEYIIRDGKNKLLETSVTGTVSLDSNKKLVLKRKLSLNMIS